ncbi:hypothetical protein Tco_0385445 [Tanacetum coccineum]
MFQSSLTERCEGKLDTYTDREIFAKSSALEVLDYHLPYEPYDQRCDAKKTTIVISCSFKNKAIDKMYCMRIVKLVDSQSFKSQPIDQVNWLYILETHVIRVP